MLEWSGQFGGNGDRVRCLSFSSYPIPTSLPKRWVISYRAYHTSNKIRFPLTLLFQETLAIAAVLRNLRNFSTVAQYMNRPNQVKKKPLTVTPLGQAQSVTHCKQLWRLKSVFISKYYMVWTVWPFFFAFAFAFCDRILLLIHDVACSCFRPRASACRCFPWERATTLRGCAAGARPSRTMSTSPTSSKSTRSGRRDCSTGNRKSTSNALGPLIFGRGIKYTLYVQN